VHRAVEVPLQIVDLRPYPPTEQESLLEKLYVTERKRLIDWEHPSLMRFFVHRRSDDSFQLSLVIHVALVDGWSVATLLTELFQIYLELLGVEIAPLAPPSSVAFREMIAVERESLASESSSRYWQAALAGSSFTMLPRWPSSRRLADPLYHKMLEVPISDELGRSLWALAQEADVQIKTVLLAAHLRVMSVLSGQDDVVIGMISNGRPEVVDGDRVTGQFLNTVPVRSQQPGGTWLDLVRATFATELDLLPHRRYPMAQIQQQQGGQPLFETIFNFTHFHVYDSLQSLPGITVLDRRFIEQTNLTLLADFGINSLTSEIRLVLNSTGLSDEQVEAMAHYYRSALVAMTRDPHARYDRQSLLPIHEREQLLQIWSASLHNERLEQRVHQLFEAQAARQPDSPALTMNDRHVTYGELNARANQWARLLVEQGVGRETLVAMLLERGVEFVTAILAIYKAGGAFVPLDPSHPAQRHAELLRQCGSPVVLTTAQFLPVLDAASVELADTQRPLIVNVEDLPPPTTDPGDLPLRCDAENLAYAMFTSGSTGQPKGAMLEQRGMRNHIYGKTLDLGLTGADVVAQNGPLSSNLIVWQCLAALLLGGRVHICDQSIAQDPRRLLAEVERGGITVLELVPSMLWAIVYELEAMGADRPTLSSLRWVVPTADALPPDLCRRWLALYPQVPLLNTYGSTEVSDDACHYPIHEPPTLENQLPIMPAGKPIVNMRAYVLDRRLEPAPIGVAGELHIGGVGVGRGYLNDPQRTARVFIPDPYSAIAQGAPGARLYKTGDLARYLPDGRLELLGRNDHQVKIRGFRVELGEIEAVLSQHPGIRQKVVVARPDASGNQSLVAYVVAEDTQPGAGTPEQADSSSQLSASQLRLFVAAHLPDYMVPSTFVVLDALPINQNGKIDRKALPMPEALRPQLDVTYVAPRTPTEETLVEIWKDLLHVDRIGVYDNFFDVGGHSLLATQLISRVRASFGITLTVRDLLLTPTVADQAAMLEAGLLEQADDALLDDLLDELDEDDLLDELDEDAAQHPIS
jgi:amino acid adenylation domain-containing protein